MELIDDHLRREHGISMRTNSPFPAQQFRERTELAKRTLTSADQARVTLTSDEHTAAVVVTRAEFEDATGPLLSRTRDIVELVVQDASLSWGRVSRVLLAGGSTRMPMVRTMLKSTSGTRVDACQNPDEIVALGAAVQAHLLDTEQAKSVERYEAPLRWSSTRAPRSPSRRHQSRCS